MSAVYNTMLNEYLAYDLLKPEIEKRSWLWENAEHDEMSVGDIIVAFERNKATSVKMGNGPVADTDISQHSYTRGKVDHANKPKIWGTLAADYEDIFFHDGKIKEKSFLGTFLPNQIKDFTNYFGETLNHNFLNSEWLDKSTAVGTVGGTITVNRIERFDVGQKLFFEDGESGYVSAVNINTSTLTVVTARGGATPVDLSTVESGDKIFNEGFNGSNPPSNLKSLLLSAANGGSANIYGQSKLASKFTQAYNKLGSDITAANILEKIFDTVVIYKRLAKIGASQIWLSSKNFGSVMKIVEQDKGPYKAVPGTNKSNEYGVTEVSLFGPKTGEMKFVCLPELDDDIIPLMNPKAYKIHSNKGVTPVKSPDGNLYYTVRSATTGYKYVTDMLFVGDIVIHQPSTCGIIHTISY